MFVHGDLRIAGNFATVGLSSVARDLWVGGTVASTALTVGRDLHQPVPNFNPLMIVAGSTIAAPFTIPSPVVLCDDADILDVAGIVDAGKTDNDNASIGLSPSALTGVVGAKSITLPCGRYYLNTISGLGVANVHVTGRTAIFVDGDIITAGILTFTLDPGAEIDIFLKGNFIPTGVVTLGDQSRPAASRIYIGGTQDVVLTGAGAFVGNLYAPRAHVALHGLRQRSLRVDLRREHRRARLDDRSLRSRHSGRRKGLSPGVRRASGHRRRERHGRRAAGTGGAPGTGGVTGTGGARAPAESRAPAVRLERVEPCLRAARLAPVESRAPAAPSRPAVRLALRRKSRAPAAYFPAGRRAAGSAEIAVACKVHASRARADRAVFGPADCCSPLVCYPDGTCGSLLL